MNLGFAYSDFSLGKNDVFHTTTTRIEGYGGSHYTWISLQLTKNLKFDC